MDWDDDLLPVFQAVRDTTGDNGDTDSDAVNTAIGRQADDLRTDNALKVLKRDLGYIEGYRDGSGRWEMVRLTGKGIQLSL